MVELEPTKDVLLIRYLEGPFKNMSGLWGWNQLGGLDSSSVFTMRSAHALL